ncbi:MAG: 50S ribosomal protein L24 [Proteobacteria bacterium]|nr:50S ribosomal protein L24 [Pseudomonadota bacterium]
MAAKLKTGDHVIVLSGRDKGKEGDITKVLPSAGRALVSGVNMVIRHTKQSQTEQGGRLSKEAPINLSNIALVDPRDGGPTRVGFKFLEDGTKVRFAKKSGEVIDG